MSKKLKISLGLASVFAIIAAAVAGTYTLWNYSEEDSTEVGAMGAVAFSVERLDTDELNAATSDSTLLPISLSFDDAQTMWNDDGVAIPLVVKARADGIFGLNYSFDSGDFPADTFFAHSDYRIWRLSATSEAAAVAECTVANAPSSQPNLSDVEAIAENDPATRLATHYWCAVGVYGGTAGLFEEEFQAVAIDDELNEVQDESSFSSSLVEEGALRVSHNVTGGN